MFVVLPFFPNRYIMCSNILINSDNFILAKEVLENSPKVMFTKK